jgi:hypothetical protein
MACKQLPNTATKQEIKDAHKVKMAAKKLVRERMHQQFKEDFERYKEWEKARLEETQQKHGTGRQHVL